MQVLQGSFVAIVTPFKDNGEIDYSALENLLDWHIAEGTNGIVSVGTTGESATLNFYEHIDVIEHTVKYVNKRLPVIAGTGANSTQEAIDLSIEAKSKGADFTLLVAPYYNKPNQNGLIAHYEKIADKVEMGHILYNVPSRTACDLIPKTVEVLSKHKNIVAIKEAGNSPEQYKALIQNKPKDFMVISGDDDLVCDVVLSGGSGVISVIGQALPALFSNMIHKGISGDEQAAKTLEKSAMPLIGLIFEENNPAGIKAVLEQLGLCNDTVRLPLVTATEGLKLKIKNALAEL